MIELQRPAALVLVVDDSESNRYVISSWLRMAGHDVLETATGGAALGALARGGIDLVVLDVNLPDMSGFAVCEDIKANAATAAIPVLHLSATSTESASRSEGLRRGAEGYLVEPVEREELLATVGALLRAAEAHRRAVRLARGLRQLNDATLAINEAVTFEELAATIARQAAELFEANAVLALVVAEHVLSFACKPGEEAANCSMSTDMVDAILLATSTHAPLPAAAFAHFAHAGRQAYLSVPVRDASAYRGVLVIEVSQGREPSFGDESGVVLSQYARAAGRAIRNVQSYSIEHAIAFTLQRSLLPESLPAIPGLEVAVRYEASAKHSDVGGDFYEIFELDADRVIVSIGDVVGHSLEAATVMAQVRTGIRAYALAGHGPAGILVQLNRLLLRFHPDDTATVCCAVFDRRDLSWELANAGHPPPLIISPGRSRFLPTGGPLLGIDAPGNPAHRFKLETDDTLLFFTDGLVERRLESLDVGFDRLERVAGAISGSMEELCDYVLRYAGPPSITDDIAVVAIRLLVPS